MTGLDVVEPALRDIDFGSETIAGAVEIMNALQDSGREIVPVRFHDGGAC